MKKSYEVLKETMTKRGAKAVAGDIGLSQSMMYKWCQPSDGPDSSGVENPLDRILKICQLTDNEAPIDWLCHQTDSFRIKNSTPHSASSVSVLDNTQSILKEFSDVLEAVTSSYANGQQIDQQEAVRIRKEWEELKSVAEQFIHDCEHGKFNQPPQTTGETSC